MHFFGRQGVKRIITGMSGQIGFCTHDADLVNVPFGAVSYESRLYMIEKRQVNRGWIFQGKLFLLLYPSLRSKACSNDYNCLIPIRFVSLFELISRRRHTDRTRGEKKRVVRQLAG